MSSPVQVKTVSCDCGQMEAMCKEASKWCAELSASVRVMREAEMELQKLDEEARTAGVSTISRQFSQ
jgi:hypothetical protein